MLRSGAPHSAESKVAWRHTGNTEEAWAHSVDAGKCTSPAPPTANFLLLPGCGLLLFQAPPEWRRNSRRQRRRCPRARRPPGPARPTSGRAGTPRPLPRSSRRRAPLPTRPLNQPLLEQLRFRRRRRRRRRHARAGPTEGGRRAPVPVHTGRTASGSPPRRRRAAQSGRPPRRRRAAQSGQPPRRRRAAHSGRPPRPAAPPARAQPRPSPARRRALPPPSPPPPPPPTRGPGS